MPRLARAGIWFCILILFLPACAPAPAPIATPVPTSTLAALTEAPVTATNPPCAPKRKIQLKIMPLGDSITSGETARAYGGYLNLLGTLLTNDGYQYDFVGSQKSPSRIIPDVDHEGHPGWSIAALQEGIDSNGWLETYQPDIVLLHIGSNDIRHGNAAYAPARLSALLDDILARLPNLRVIVAQIIPFRWGVMDGNRLYNNAIPDIVSSKGSRVSMVDMQNILVYEDYTGSIHPNQKGYDKIARAWEQAILALDLSEGCTP
jgi:lysophospholipase L1-like esterase